MLSKFIEVTTGNGDLSTGMYYFGGADDGSMKTGAQTVKDDNGDTYKFYFGTKNSGSEKKGVGITGNKSNKLYYKGLLLTADDYKYQVAEVLGKKFIVNANGAIQHSNVEYKEDGDVLIDTRVGKDSAGNEIPKATFDTTDGLTKYSYVSGNFINNVDEIDVTKVMH